MPKPTLLPWLAACALLAANATVPTSVSGAQAVKLKVAFQPNRIGARTTILFGFDIAGPHGTPPSPITSLDLRLSAHMGIATTTLGQANCYPGPLIREGLRGCSENARIGFGDAIAVVPVPGDPVTEHTSLTALMGPPAPSRLEVMFYAEGLTPVFATLVFPGVVLADNDPFGDRIDTSIPLVPSWAEGPNVALTHFSSTIGPLHLAYHWQVNGKRLAYQLHGILIPRRCPSRGFPSVRFSHSRTIRQPRLLHACRVRTVEPARSAVVPQAGHFGM